jgi:hypothetical protein
MQLTLLTIIVASVMQAIGVQSRHILPCQQRISNLRQEPSLLKVMAVTVHSVTSATMVQDTLGLVSLISQQLVHVVPMVQAKV